MRSMDFTPKTPALLATIHEALLANEKLSKPKSLLTLSRELGIKNSVLYYERRKLMKRGIISPRWQQPAQRAGGVNQFGNDDAIQALIDRIQAGEIPERKEILLVLSRLMVGGQDSTRAAVAKTLLAQLSEEAEQKAYIVPKTQEERDLRLDRIVEAAGLASVRASIARVEEKHAAQATAAEKSAANNGSAGGDSDVDGRSPGYLV